ncbi:ParB/RepB/Spo0J family partition protein [Mariniplasma anaerobium]|uniref:Chromosome partitioning protein ParB n=1 Tax=Mariniplasma anaerobium TaxID=2735436 RepID=A0A7U9THG3_9MOLU|nr:ParB/RepB/Spo0J family partition protein [Mariniplasma anaerobium]BCR35317.1 chromosome partitioning protein ParB [Mariniplasma anaerobium]
MKEDKKPRTLTDLLKEHHVDDVLEGEVIDEISLNEIKPNPFQPRRIFDQEKIDELAQSIREHGIFQPIIIKKQKDGFIIVSGERRYRAAQQVGLKTIPSIIRQYEASKVAEIALAENLQRENLTPIEEAEAYKVVMNHLSLTQTELAHKIGKSRSHVTNMLGLLNLPSETQDMLLTSQISMGHARALSKLENAAQINKLAKLIVSKQLSVRQVEELTQTEDKTNKIRRTPRTRYVLEEKKLTTYLKHKVRIDDKKIIIYYDENELDSMLDRLLKK